MEPTVTILLSEYQKLRGRPYYDVEKENRVLRKIALKAFMSPSGEAIHSAVTAENNCTVVVLGGKGVPEDLMIMLK